MQMGLEDLLFSGRGKTDRGRLEEDGNSDGEGAADAVLTVSPVGEGGRRTRRQVTGRTDPPARIGPEVAPDARMERRQNDGDDRRQEGKGAAAAGKTAHGRVPGSFFLKYVEMWNLLAR